MKKKNRAQTAVKPSVPSCVADNPTTYTFAITISEAQRQAACRATRLFYKTPQTLPHSVTLLLDILLAFEARHDKMRLRLIRCADAARQPRDSRYLETLIAKFNGAATKVAAKKGRPA